MTASVNAGGTGLHQPMGPSSSQVNIQVKASFLLRGARILDPGGPGRYTIWLAQRGHRVVLAGHGLEPVRLLASDGFVADNHVVAYIESGGLSPLRVYGDESQNVIERWRIARDIT